MTEPKRSTKKKIKSETYFDIKKFKNSLDECNFNKMAFTLEKKGRYFYFVVISYDPETEVGVVKKTTKLTGSQEMAMQILDEMNYCTNLGLPIRRVRRSLLP